MVVTVTDKFGFLHKLQSEVSQLMALWTLAQSTMIISLSHWSTPLHYDHLSSKTLQTIILSFYPIYVDFFFFQNPIQIGGIIILMWF